MRWGTRHVNMPVSLLGYYVQDHRCNLDVHCGSRRLKQGSLLSSCQLQAVHPHGEVTEYMQRSDRWQFPAMVGWLTGPEV